MTAVHQLHPPSDPPDDDDRVVSLPWRAGRPVEDPEKTKRWGFITAKPSEYLIHVRRGKIRRRSTGQGASCFKFPWDSVAVVPTTINRLQFKADQVTREKVGMEVCGLAVYRIVAPEVTFRMLNFSFGERASRKLEEILREMFVGATRRHVANLTIEQVMTQRKDAIAAELMAELAPVLDGSGRSDDTTVCGWGVVLDTVEIQNVRVLSERVFADMQASFRAELAARASEAQLASAQTIAAREAESKREIEAARLETDRATREMRATAETRAVEIELAQKTKRDAMEARVEQDRLTRDQAHELASMRSEAEVATARADRAEASRLAQLARDQRLCEAEAELAKLRHAEQTEAFERAAKLQFQKQEAAAALREAASEAEDAITRRELDQRLRDGEVDNRLADARRRIENTISEDKIRLAVVESAMPALAEALAPNIGELRITQLGGTETADPTTMMVRGLTQLLEVARSLGVSLDKPKPE